MNSGLTWFANIWLGIAIMINVLVVAGALITSVSIWDGVGQVRSAYDPLDLRTWFFQVCLFAPVFVARLWRNWRQDRPIR